jgi:hypothetical protein
MVKMEKKVSGFVLRIEERFFVRGFHIPLANEAIMEVVF